MADYADTPWWSNLIAVLVTLVVSVVGTIYYMKSGVPAVGVAAPSGIGTLLKDTLVYMPHALLLYGVLADMLTYEGVYSIASLVGLLSLVVHVLFKFIWQGTFDVIEKVMDVIKNPGSAAGTDSRADSPTRIGAKGTPPNLFTSSPAKGTTPKFGGGKFFESYDGCDIQGFGWAHSRFSPQSLVIIATIFSYYTFDLVANRGWANATATIVLGLFTYVVQLLLAGDCTVTGEEPVGTFYKAILAGAEGLFVGGVSYSVVQAYFPARLPSSAISPFPKMTPNMLKDGKYDKDGNPWVCVGGVCYPDMSTQEARKKFADIAAASTGNGKSAVSEDCPAS